MAHQDYVKRSRSANKKKNPYKSTAEPIKATMPLKVKLIGLITLCLIIGFSYALWSIKDNRPSTTTVTTTTENKAKTSPKASNLPEPPKEKWSYVDQLKTKEVAVSEYKIKSAGPYQMQCGSFRTKKQAEVLKATIAFTGIEADIRQTQGKTGTWYKVILGPYPRKRLAEQDKHKLSRNQVNHCQIWGWR